MNGSAQSHLDVGEADFGSHQHEHAHGMSGAPERALWLALILNGGFLVVEVIVGLAANSLTLLSDAGHMVSDVAALGLALIAHRLAQVEVGGSYTFGLNRVPVLGALINSATLLIIVGFVFYEAATRFMAPPDVAGVPVLIAGVIGLAINLGSAAVLHRSGEGSLNIRGAIVHLLADALGSVAAVASAIVILTTGWTTVDPVLSIFVGVLILASTWPLLKEATDVILQRAPRGIDVDELRAAVLSHPCTESIRDIHLWELNTGEPVMSAVICTNTTRDLLEINHVSDELKEALRKRFGIVHATLEWRDPRCVTAGCETEGESRRFKSAAVH